MAQQALRAGSLADPTQLEAARPWLELRLSRIAALLVLPASLCAAVSVFGLPLEPDAGYYVGGIALFPSPLGTLLGTAGGYTGLAALNAAATFAIMVLVALLALELGNRPLLAQGLALLIVPATWFRDWGMDAPGVALLLTAALLELRGRSRWAVTVAALAAATHLAVLPLALGAVVARRGRRGIAIAVGLAVAGAAVALLTAYRVSFHVLADPHAFVEGGRELLLVCWPVVLLSAVAPIERRARPLVYGSAAGAVLAGAIPASVGQLGETRYAVPCVFLAVAALQFRSLRVRFTVRGNRQRAASS